MLWRMMTMLISSILLSYGWLSIGFLLWSLYLSDEWFRFLTFCREAAFFLVIHHFSRECQHILSELRSHPKSLFLYLKTIFEVHLAGTLNFSCLTKDETMGFRIGRKVRDQSVEAYLERISDFPKFLRSNPVLVTDEMIELYLEVNASTFLCSIVNWMLG